MSELRQFEKIRTGDTARESVIRLDVRGRNLPVDPVSAVLRVDGDSVTVRTLTSLGGGEWYFRWTDEDFEAFPVGTYTGQVRVTFDDGSEATFPTEGSLTIQVKSRI